MNQVIMNAVDGVVQNLLAVTFVATVLPLLACLIVYTGRLRLAVQRHLVWLYCLIGIAVLPCLILYGPKLTLAILPARTKVVQTVEQAPKKVTPVADKLRMADIKHTPQFTPSQTPTDHAKLLPARPESSDESQLPTIAIIKFAVAMLYVGGLLAMLLRMAVGLIRWRSLCAQAEAAPQGVAHLVVKRTRIRMLVSDRLASPVCGGILRPVVVLPRSLLSAGSEELRMVLRHEFAHVQRGDNLTNLLQRLIEAAYFYHPLVWLASVRLTQEREHICDNYVLADGADARSYADLLARIAESYTARPLAQTVALFEGRLLARVTSLLDSNRNLATRLSLRAAIACAVAALIAGGAVGTVRLAANDSPRQSNPPLSTADGNKMIDSNKDREDAWERMKLPEFLTAAVVYAKPFDGITIDGKIDDWPTNTPKYHLIHPYAPYGPSDLKGDLRLSRDLSAYFMVTWSPRDQMVYVAVVVDDDDHVPTNPDYPKANSSECDCVELYFDGLNAERRHAWSDRTYPANLASMQYVAIAGPGLPFIGAGARNPGKTNPYVIGVDVTTTKNNCKWSVSGRRVIYEWRCVVYESYPAVAALKPGRRFGFDVIVADLDRHNGKITDHAAWVPFGAPGVYKMLDAGTLADLVLLGPDQPLTLVSGIAHLESGKAVADKTMQFYRSNWSGSYPMGQVVTDAQGKWSIELPAGEYRVKADDQARISPEKLSVIAGQAQQIQFQISPAKISIPPNSTDAASGTTQ
ncbi:MAG: M56 family metallopeptidase [Phycisphaerae bacterium]